MILKFVDTASCYLTLSNVLFVYAYCRYRTKTILVSGKEPTSSLPGEKDEASAGLRIQPPLPQEHLSHFFLLSIVHILRHAFIKLFCMFKYGWFAGSFQP
jgi:hypothetical protein